jgi:Ca-activated chloride channel family protein
VKDSFQFQTLSIKILLALAALFCFQFIAFSQNPTDDEIRIDSSLVLLNVSVRDANGRFVTGLKRDLFSIFEDGVKQEITYFSSEETPFAAIILLDTSGSMEERVVLARSAALQFLDRLRPQDTAAIYTFDSKISLIQPFSSSRDAVDKLYEVKSDGMTKLNDAIYLAAGELRKRPEKRRAIILLSDGQDTVSGRSAEAALRSALESNCVIYTIDMSPTGAPNRFLNQGPLKFFAEKSGGQFIDTPGGAALRDAFTKIVEELGNQYTLGYSLPEDKADGKWHSIELRIARPNLQIRTRKGYQAPKAKK